MKYLRLFEDLKSRFIVVIEWEHGDADKKTLQRYPFSLEEDMNEFLNFIFDVRKFKNSSGYREAGHFEDGHEQRMKKNIIKVDNNKYGGKYSELIPMDIYYKNSEYTPAVNSIWVEIDNQPLNIIWGEALKTKILNLPKIGDKITVSTGNISFHGPTLWKRDQDYFMSYQDFEHKDIDSPIERGFITEYAKINCYVSDCKINTSYYKHKSYSDNEIGYNTYSDFLYFEYILLCGFNSEFNSRYITVTDKRFVGFDPNYDKKFHYPLYGLNEYYLVN